MVPWGSPDWRFYHTVIAPQAHGAHNRIMEFPTPMQSSSITSAPRLRRNAALSLLALAACAAPAAQAQSLLGSHESLLKQNEEAREHDFTYLRTTSDVREFAQEGFLVRLPGNSDYDLAGDEVSFPYARPEVKTFVERLSDQYHSACGERLVVTSLTRPITRQPPNASVISVHPTGMAVDLRRSDSAGCRQWLETVLLDLENKGVVEATREQYPPHYHVAVFPNPYSQYLAEGNKLPEIQIARSTQETASRARVTRTRTTRTVRSRSSVKIAKGRSSRSHGRAAVVTASHRRSSGRVSSSRLASHHVTTKKKSARVVRAANHRVSQRRSTVARAKQSGSRRTRTSSSRTR
jgi:hypothetical protein